MKDSLFTHVFSSNPTEDLLLRLLIAVLIGLLVGVERERNLRGDDQLFAGIRTYPLIAVLGFLSGLISSKTSDGVFIAIFFIYGFLVVTSYYFSAKKINMGGTSEISLILVFLLGYLVYLDYVLLSAIITFVIVSFLAFKSQLHKFADKISQEDIYATIKFALITLIVLPLLPNKTYDPFDVINPQKIWYLVVLIAGVSFIGYVLFKIIGTKKGIQLLSILGGLASSTAVTLSFTSLSKEHNLLSKSYAAGILMASSIMFPRVLLIIAVLNIELALKVAVPFLILFIFGIVFSSILWKRTKSKAVEKVKIKNPFKVMFAVKFGILFAVILFIASAAQFYFGEKGIYLSSLFAGFADVDAIVLSLTQLTNQDLNIDTAAIGIVIACTANSIVKGFISSFLGSVEMRKYTLTGFGIIIALSILYILIFMMY